MEYKSLPWQAFALSWIHDIDRRSAVCWKIGVPCWFRLSNTVDELTQVLALLPFLILVDLDALLRLQVRQLPLQPPDLESLRNDGPHNHAEQTNE